MVVKGERMSQHIDITQFLECYTVMLLGNTPIAIQYNTTIKEGSVRGRKLYLSDQSKLIEIKGWWFEHALSMPHFKDLDTLCKCLNLGETERKALIELKEVLNKPVRKIVYSKEEIQEMLDKGEDITDIILDPSLKDLSYLFSDRVDFNQDISNWNVSNVTDMAGMFCDAESFNQDISNWDTSNVENMYMMFYAAKSFNQDLSNWDVSNAEHKYDMFEDSGYTFPYPKGY
jgi:surface protein